MKKTDSFTGNIHFFTATVEQSKSEAKRRSI